MPFFLSAALPLGKAITPLYGIHIIHPVELRAYLRISSLGQELKVWAIWKGIVSVTTLCGFEVGVFPATYPWTWLESGSSLKENPLAPPSELQLAPFSQLLMVLPGWCLGRSGERLSWMALGQGSQSSYLSPSLPGTSPSQVSTRLTLLTTRVTDQLNSRSWQNLTQAELYASRTMAIFPLHDNQCRCLLSQSQILVYLDLTLLASP